jgi:CheY-like chemotaxis protein
LIVEDNLANQKFMQILFKKLNLGYEIANDGVEAFQMYQNHQYGLILMDENMPNLNGIETTKKILEYEQKYNLPHTPIITVTANALSGDEMRFLNVGMDGYISKPIKKDKLIKILKKFLEGDNNEI